MKAEKKGCVCLGCSRSRHVTVTVSALAQEILPFQLDFPLIFFNFLF